MSPTQTSSPSSRTIPTTELIEAKYLRPNPWNPNRMTQVMRTKARESIERYGFIDPLLVREVGLRDYQIIDGEHRFDEGKALGLTEFPCVNLGLIDDADAKKLTIVMNELHGQADPTKLGDLLGEILSDTGLTELLVAMPFDDKVLAGYLQTPLPSLPPLGAPPGSHQPSPAGEDKPVWAERLFRMPKEVALVIDEALEKAKDGEEIEQWQALERVAADYLAS
jgi:ParB-like chromosome segregation protein Spo0J